MCVSEYAHVCVRGQGGGVSAAGRVLGVGQLVGGGRVQVLSVWGEGGQGRGGGSFVCC